jgi:hypothetical protein
MDEETKDLLRSIDSRLKWILKLEAESQFNEEATNREKVEKLYRMGFDTGEMDEIIGTSEGSIRGTRSNLRDEGVID